MPNLVKAEILWSRTCGLKCPYCAMVTNDKTKKDLSLWKKGVEQLKQLNCNFCAIYGAEPLDDFDGLPEFIRMLYQNNILSTIITNACSPNTKEKLSILYANGLRSLTTSYDGEGDEIIDNSSRAKTNRGLELIRWFRDSFVDLRDVAVVATIHRKNYKSIPKIIEKMTKENIWMLFDIIHPDRNQPGSKCKNCVTTDELLFQPEDLPGVINVLKQILGMKNNSYLVHWSKNLVDYIVNNPTVLLKYNWHCAKDKIFPSWVTVENTGEVYCCDDFHVVDPKLKHSIYLWELADRFEEFTKYQKEMALKYCSGCIWNTHFDANAIKQGNIPFGNYVHTDRKN